MIYVIPLWGDYPRQICFRKFYVIPSNYSHTPSPQYELPKILFILTNLKYILFSKVPYQKFYWIFQKQKIRNEYSYCFILNFVNLKKEKKSLLVIDEIRHEYSYQILLKIKLSIWIPIHILCFWKYLVVFYY